jgi:hypothetical protein
VEAKKWYQMDVVSNGTSSPPSFNVTSSNEVLTSNPKPIQNNAGAKSVEQRLFELKSLMDKGLITSAQFEQKRIEILNSL